MIVITWLVFAVLVVAWGGWVVSVTSKTRRLAILMKGLKVSEKGLHGWVAVNGNLENALVVQGVDDEGQPSGPGSMPVWLEESAGEDFLEGLRDLRSLGAPANARLARILVLEVTEDAE